MGKKKIKPLTTKTQHLAALFTHIFGAKSVMVSEIENEALAHNLQPGRSSQHNTEGPFQATLKL